MNLPLDCPEWAERAFRSLEETVSDLINKSDTADKAMKAAGAYWMWTKLKDEIESEHVRQSQLEKQRIAALHARPRADA